MNYIFIRLVIADKRDYLDGTKADPTGQWTGRKPELFYSGSVVGEIIRLAFVVSSHSSEPHSSTFPLM